MPDFNVMYELYDECTIMFFFRNKHIMIDLGTGNNNKVRSHWKWWAFRTHSIVIFLTPHLNQTPPPTYNTNRSTSSSRTSRR